jgi:predicted kinase
MHSILEDLASQAIAMSDADRARLAELLLASLPAEQSADVDAAWDAVLAERVQAVREGRAELIDAEVVRTQARAVYGR